MYYGVHYYATFDGVRKIEHVFLFITSVTIPTVTAEPAPIFAAGAAAAPETAELIIGGI